MADRLKDELDEELTMLFRAEPVADDGFSEHVTRLIRRRMRIRRVALPIAAVIGGAIALDPLASLVRFLADLSRALPFDLVRETSGWIPSLPLLGLGGMLLVAMMLGLRILDE